MPKRKGKVNLNSLIENSDERKRQKRIADAGIAYEFEGYAAPKDGAAVEKPKPTKTKKLGTTKEAKAGSKRPAPRASRKKG